MRKIVEDLIRIDGVIGSLLVGKDGLVVSSTLLEDEDAEVLGAMAAAMFGTITKATERIGVGGLTNTIIEAAEGAECDRGSARAVGLAVCRSVSNTGSGRPRAGPLE